MSETFGQDISYWHKWWENKTPESEIQIWDFYAGRHWVLKYVPRNGVVLELGCGFGRYNFIFDKMGITTEGIDFDEELIKYLEAWKLKHNLTPTFRAGNVLDLPYENDSVSGCVSLGVVEHFIEGPQKAIAEIYRILKPGGIAIISTPSITFHNFYFHIKKFVRNLLRKYLHFKLIDSPFFQYWYRPNKLVGYIKNSGLKVTQYRGVDLLSSFFMLGKETGDNIYEWSFAVKLANYFENTFLSNLGAQSFTISVKEADRMYCFFCDRLSATRDSLRKYVVPICSDCVSEPLTKFYRKGFYPYYDLPYIINSPLLKPEVRQCYYCKGEYLTDEIFEDFGFSRNVCWKCLKNRNINIELAVKFVKPIWRKRA